jgi:hypothetical protein
MITEILSPFLGLVCNMKLEYFSKWNEEVAKDWMKERRDFEYEYTCRRWGVGGGW